MRGGTGWIDVPSPLGLFWIGAREGAVTGLRLPGQPAPEGPAEDSPLLRRAKEELLEYLSGGRREFDLPLAPEGTAFQRQVWQALAAIPYGQTRTYGDLAAALGRPKAVRAVGQANHRNPIPIFLPCHRVVGKDGSLTGYAGGLALKEKLLRLEGIWPVPREKAST